MCNEIHHQDGFPGSLPEFPREHTIRYGRCQVQLRRFQNMGNLFGGFQNEYAAKIAVDPSGNAIAYCYTTSTGLATSGAHQVTNNGGDALVVKFDTSGGVDWATYFGGNSGETSGG